MCSDIKISTSVLVILIIVLLFFIFNTKNKENASNKGGAGSPILTMYHWSRGNMNEPNGKLTYYCYPDGSTKVFKENGSMAWYTDKDVQKAEAFSKIYYAMPNLNMQCSQVGRSGSWEFEVKNPKKINVVLGYDSSSIISCAGIDLYESISIATDRDI